MLYLTRRNKNVLSTFVKTEKEEKLSEKLVLFKGNVGFTLK